MKEEIVPNIGSAKTFVSGSSNHIFDSLYGSNKKIGENNEERNSRLTAE